LSPRSERSGPAVAALALLGVLILFAWRSTLSMPFTGVDIWPILAQAKAALADPSILFRQRYLEGLWDGARFWRPGLTAYTALQWALFGDQPFGYHAMRLGLLGLAAALAGVLAARHGAAPRLAFAVAALVYALHPLQAETIPVTSRDADTLATALVLGALVALSGREPLRPGRLAAGVLLALLAPTVKEPALLAPILAILALAPWRPRPGRRAALVASAILAAGLAAQLLYRIALLGTIGRYERELPMPLGETVRELAAGLLDHQRWGLAPLVGALLVAALVAWLFLLRSGTVPAAAPGWPSVRRAGLFWIAAAAASFLSAPVFRLRYGEGLLAPLAVFAGAGAGAAWIAARAAAAGSGRHRTALRSAPLVLLGLGLVLALLPGTPLAWRYPQWELAGRTADAVLEAAGETVAAALASGGREDGAAGRFQMAAEAAGPRSARVLIDPFPFQPAEPQQPLSGRTANVAILAPYAVQSWFQLERGWPVGSIQVLDGTPLLGVKPQDLGPEVTVRGY
jgi:hypothetical protein